MKKEIIGYKIFENERQFIEWQSENAVRIFTVQPVSINVTQKNQVGNVFDFAEMTGIEDPIARIDYLWSQIARQREVIDPPFMAVSCGVFVTYRDDREGGRDER